MASDRVDPLRAEVEKLAEEWEWVAEYLCQRGDYRDGVFAAHAADLRAVLVGSDAAMSELRRAADEIERLAEWLVELGHPMQDCTIDRLEAARALAARQG